MFALAVIKSFTIKDGIIYIYIQLNRVYILVSFFIIKYIESAELRVDGRVRE